MRNRRVIVLSSVAALVAALLVVALVFVFSSSASPTPASALGAPSPTPTTTNESTPTPGEAAEQKATPSPGTEPMPAPEPPPAPLDDECAKVLTDAQLDDLLGDGWMTYDIPTDSMRRVSIGTLGGIDCRWLPENMVTAGVSAFSVIILPATQVPSTFAAAYSPPECDQADWTACRAAGFAGDYWVLARADAVSGKLPTQMLERAVAHVADTIGPTFDGAARARGADWLSLPACDDLAREIRLEEIIGTGYKNGDNWGATVEPEGTMLTDAGVAVGCPWFSVDGSGPGGASYFPSAAFAAGGAWAWDAIAALDSAVPADVHGAVGAVALETGGPGATLYVTDGVNLIAIGGLEARERVIVAERILAALRS